MNDLVFRAARTDHKALKSYVDLFAACFPGSEKLNSDYLKWLYADNPTGPVIGVDAFDGENLVAHYAVVPVEVICGGERMLACWSLNTATHPTYQGRGLFTRLAEATYQEAAQKGCVGVIGIANRNSTPGFLKKLGFKLHGQVHVAVGFGQVSHSTCKERMRRAWTPELLRWRLRNPSRQYFTEASGSEGLVGLLTKTGRYSPPVALGSFDRAIAGRDEFDRSSRFRGATPRVLVGFNGAFDKRSIAVPHRFLPSPWNVIYRPLTSVSGGDITLEILGLDMDTF